MRTNEQVLEGSKNKDGCIKSIAYLYTTTNNPRLKLIIIPLKKYIKKNKILRNKLNKSVKACTLKTMKHC